MLPHFSCEKAARGCKQLVFQRPICIFFVYVSEDVFIQTLFSVMVRV